MKKNPMCYGCIYCQKCDKDQEEKCASMDYVLYTTKEDRMYCDMICGKIEKD